MSYWGKTEAISSSKLTTEQLLKVMSADSNTGFQPSSDNRPVCQYFARRQCKKGRFCNFLHVITIDRDNQPGNEFPLSDQNSAEHSQGNSVDKNPKKISNKNVPHHKKSGTVCKHWAQKGWCRFGNGCRYSHVNHKEDEEVHLSDKAVEDSQIAASEAAQPAVSEAALPDTEESQNVAASNTEAESQTELKCQSNNENTGMKSSDKSPRKSRPVCRYFNYGYCANGRRCRFLHQRDQLNSVSKRKGEALHVDAKTETKRSTLEQKVEETCSIKKTDCEKTFEDMRKTEITQFCKRFPDAKEVVENSTFRFVFTPTDPDWVRFYLKLIEFICFYFVLLKIYNIYLFLRYNYFIDIKIISVKLYCKLQCIVLLLLC